MGFMAMAELFRFQSTLPQGERRSDIVSPDTTSRFQSTLPQGERLFVNCSCFLQIQFQSTLPQGERPSSGSTLASHNRISIHAPARGATRCTCARCSWISYFNPRSRKGSDALGTLEELQIMKISIHAPARGATIATMNHFNERRFQSTLPQGERQGDGRKQPGIIGYFNPRSRKGSDSLSGAFFSGSSHFNPRSRKGSDSSGTIIRT